MEPFTQALGVLQNEEKMSLGCVLPTIKLLQEKMGEFSKDSSIVYCESLVLEIISGLHTRFGEMFKNVHMRLASNNGGDVSPKKKTRFLDGYKTKRDSLEADEVESYLNDGNTLTITKHFFFVALQPAQHSS
ncbi:hypothetical protein OUZ56_011020 [Daphnia magna]|uniref:Uncharacterized protein n=1 Tax=Daphnia magna TaxID=35525 RepID=A0ABQ9YZ24_9CRUS|nr:hypothetical protein OUZ56_011020 [Daphnia magna]